MDKIFEKPRLIYRKISKVRFQPPKSKYGSSKSRYGPPRPKYKPHKSSRKPGKKSRTGKPKTSSPRYGPPEGRNRHGAYPNKKHNKNNAHKFRPNFGRPGFGHVVKMPHYSFFVPDKASFGEPPVPKDQRSQKGYGEPPVDSYGAPVKPGIVDVVFPTPNTFQNFQDTSHQNDFLDHNEQDQQKNHNYIDAGSDTSFSFTKKEPAFSNYVTSNPIDAHEFLNPADRPKSTKFFFRKLKPYYYADAKLFNKKWKLNKPEVSDDEIIVGGQYAEPPARAVPRSRQYLPMYGEDYDEEYLPAFQGYVDIDGPQSASHSPYSNYKNSNMAFSPQNLNDAFSIIDK